MPVEIAGFRRFLLLLRRHFGRAWLAWYTRGPSFSRAMSSSVGRSSSLVARGIAFFPELLDRGEVGRVEADPLLGAEFCFEIRERRLDGDQRAPRRIEAGFDGFQSCQRIPRQRQ